MVTILLITPLNIPFRDALDWVGNRSNAIDTNDIKRKLDPKYPIGNLSIGAYVKQNVSDTIIDILDYNTVGLRYFKSENKVRTLDAFLDHGLERIKEKNNYQTYEPDIIGISALFSSNYYDIGSIIDHFANTFPRSIMVSGGHLASACYSEFLHNFTKLHAIGYGECEIPFARLIEAFKHSNAMEYLAHDASWITKNKIADTNFRPTNFLVEDLDTIPPYELEMLLHQEDYYHTNDDLFTLGTNKNDPTERDIAMFATRGCPYHCIFCASQFVHGHKVRYYSTERIKSDIIFYNKKYGIKSFPFLDDHFIANKQKSLEILNFILNNGFSSRIFNLPYIHLDRDIIKTLKQTGSDRVLITVDGLNEHFLRKVVKKPANFRKAKEIIGICREEGLTVINNIIIGFPGETPDSIDEGIETILDMGAHWYAILTAIPLHGSELYNICKENNYLPANDSIYSIDYHKTVIRTPDFTPEWIQNKAYEINLKVNFVNNYDMRNGEYETPLSLFERLLEKVIDTHAFAYYFAAICSERLNRMEKYEHYKAKYYQMIEQHVLWKTWASHFNLPNI